MVAIDWTPTRVKLRQFAWAWLVFVGVLWPGIALLRAHWRMALVAVGLGVAGWALGMLRPTLLRWPFVGLSVITWPIGQVVGRLALLVVFLLFVTPLGLVQRAFGRDVLGRRVDRSAATYWRPRAQPETARYLRQS